MMTTKTQLVTSSTIEKVKPYLQLAVKTEGLSRDQLNGIIKALKLSSKTEAPEQHLMTTAQVAQLYNCSKRTIHRMAEDNRLTPVYLRPGNAKSLRFKAREVFAIFGDEVAK